MIVIILYMLAAMNNNNGGNAFGLGHRTIASPEVEALQLCRIVNVTAVGNLFFMALLPVKAAFWLAVC